MPKSSSNCRVVCSPRDFARRAELLLVIMPAMLPELTESNDILSDAEALQRRLESDGYLFFRRLLDVDQLLTLRREMLTTMQRGGWLVSDSDPMDGIADLNARTTEGDAGYTDVYHEVYKGQAFHEIAHCRAVLDVLERVRGCPMMPLPQKVARLWFPQMTEHTTPIHQDFVHFQGTYDNLTCWSPVGDCPRELGGLAVLRGSHKVDRVLDHHFSLGAGSLYVDPDEHGEVGDEWLTTDYLPGDTLVFPALTIHKALPNVTESRLRVSLDNRYQRVGDPIADHMLLPHLNTMSQLSWDEVYEGWQDRESSLQYYWRSVDNPVIPRIMEYSNRGFEEAIELAKGGDERAKLHLRRIAERDPDSEQGKTASMILTSVDE